MTFRHLDAVVAEVAPLAERFVEAGHGLYLVGGIVRDQWLDRPLDEHSDIDLTTDAHPGTIKSLVSDLAHAVWTQGERFGTIGLHYHGRAIEITTHRAESYAPDSRKPEVTFGSDINVDLSRRDFTVNAMAIALPSGELVDPWSGADDLGIARLRTPLEPHLSFADDPLRMLRAARFAAKYGLEPTPELVQAARDFRERLRIVAIERIGDELHRLFALADAATGVDLLVRTGLAEILLGWPSGGLDDVAAARLPVAVDALRAEALSSSEIPWHARLAAFLLAAFDDADLVEDASRRLRLSKDIRRRVNRAVRSAVAARSIGDHDTPSLRRWLAATDEPDLAITVALAVADGEAAADALRRFADAAARLRDEEDQASLEPLDGGTVMAALELEPGPVVGEAVEMLRQAIFDRGALTEQAQLALLRDWWASRPAQH